VGGGGGDLFVFLWTVVTHGLEVSFKDKCWEPDSSSLTKTQSKNMTGNKMLAQKLNPSKLVDDF